MWSAPYLALLDPPFCDSRSTSPFSLSEPVGPAPNPVQGTFKPELVLHLRSEFVKGRLDFFLTGPGKFSSDSTARVLQLVPLPRPPWIESLICFFDVGQEGDPWARLRPVRGPLLSLRVVLRVLTVPPTRLRVDLSYSRLHLSPSNTS